MLKGICKEIQVSVEYRVVGDFEHSIGTSRWAKLKQQRPPRAIKGYQDWTHYTCKAWLWIINPIYHMGADHQLQFSYCLMWALWAAGIALKKNYCYVQSLGPFAYRNWAIRILLEFFRIIWNLLESFGRPSTWRIISNSLESFGWPRTLAVGILLEFFAIPCNSLISVVFEVSRVT